MGMEMERYLHQALGGFEEVLATLRLGALLVPVDDRLIRYAVLVVQDLKSKAWYVLASGKCLHHWARTNL
jgi:hypothetical protein